MASRSSDYTTPPPAYSSTPAGESSTPREPLLGREWENDDIPDDFKYGVTVDKCDVHIRNAFVGKVYSILAVQVFFTVVTGASMIYNESLKFWVQSNVWLFWTSLIGTFACLAGLFFKSRSYPANYILLGLFTFFESYTIGMVITLYETEVVLQALIITLGLFFGLTLFTLQSKWDFSGMGPILFGLLWVLIILGFVQIFIPFSTTLDLIIGIGSAIIFCAFIIYDTHALLHKLNPEDYVIASISLYLDFLNLFLSILRILNDLKD